MGQKERGLKKRMNKAMIVKMRQLWVVLPYLWYGLMLAAPLVTVIALSFSEFSIGSPPYQSLLQWFDDGIIQVRLCITNYGIVVTDSFYRAAFGNSLWIALVSTVICIVLGYPMAYGIARSKHKFIWLMLAILPFFTSFLVRVYAWMTLLSPQGVVAHCIKYLFGTCDVDLINTPYAVIVGVVYCYLPFMVFPLYSVLDKMDISLLEAAYDLGCKPLSAFWRITVPLSRPGIVAGSSLVFIPAMGEYMIPELLGGPTSLTIGRLIWEEFFANRDWPLAAALAVIMILVLFIPIVVFEKLQNFFERRTQ
jgi:putrescine transport system permease protein